MSPAAAVARRYSPLALFRMARGFRQSDIAARTGIDDRALSKIETGARRANAADAARIARALGAPRAAVSRLLARTRTWAEGR